MHHLSAWPQGKIVSRPSARRDPVRPRQKRLASANGRRNTTIPNADKGRSQSTTAPGVLPRTERRYEHDKIDRSQSQTEAETRHVPAALRGACRLCRDSHRRHGAQRRRYDDDDRRDRPTEEVRYADLDLDTPQGRAQLDTRIETAVEHVCGSADLRDLPAYADMRSCRTQSTQQAFAARDTVLAARDHGEQVAVLAVARAATAGRPAR